MGKDEDSLVGYLKDGESESFMTRSILENLAFYQNIDTDERADAFAGSIYNWFIRECVRRNQYLVFPEETYSAVFALYRRLVIALRALPPEDATEETIRALVREHRHSLVETARVIPGIGRETGAILPCAEYSADLQLSVLGIDPGSVQGPFLDIGCGEGASLVRAIRARGTQAVGIDQYQPPGTDECVIRANWLEFRYIPGYWGTIVSHMAFSNHYIRALRSEPDLAARYRSAYRDILESLKAGGIFCYAPAIADAEALVDRERFEIRRSINVAGNRDLDTTRITRLR